MNLDQFKKIPVLGILRGIKKPHVEPLFDASIQAGLKAVEIALNTPDAFGLISHASRLSKNIFLGAGTVLDLESAKKCIDSGASFIVAPNFNEDILKFSLKNKIPYFPGAFTPSEIFNAWKQGASMVKLFPASVFGPRYFKEILGPFNGVELMAVGGVKPDNIGEYLKNGAKAAAFGASVYKKELIESEKFDEIKNLISEFITAYEKYSSFRPAKN